MFSQELVRDLEERGGLYTAGRPSHTPRVPARVSAAFAYFDRNGSGFLDYRELRNALRHYGVDVSSAGAMSVVAAYDDRPDGKHDDGDDDPRTEGAADSREVVGVCQRAIRETADPRGAQFPRANRADLRRRCW